MKYCSTVNHWEDAANPTIIARIVSINPCKGSLALCNRDAILRFVSTTMRKIAAPAMKRKAFVLKLIKKISWKFNALNQRYSVKKFAILLKKRKNNSMRIMNMFFPQAPFAATAGLLARGF